MQKDFRFEETNCQMKHNRRLRTEYSEIIQPIQISKCYMYAYCTFPVIAVHTFKYSTNMLGLPW